MADNWYVILELDFDPPVEDEQKIADMIDEKAKFWCTHFNDFKMGAQYRTWHQNIPQIKKDMIGSANIRKQLAKDACEIMYAQVDKLLKIIGTKGSITADEGDKISKKLKISVDLVKKRAIELGIKWNVGDNSKDFQAVYDKYYKTKPQNASSFDGIKQMLSSFNVEDLYDFLYTGTNVKDANKLSCETLRLRAAEKKKTEFYKNDSISGTGSKLCSQCELTFKDNSSKDVYDKYIEYIKRKEILDDAKSVAEISGELTSEQANDIIKRLTHILEDRKLSEDILTAFCKIEKISYVFDTRVHEDKNENKNENKDKSEDVKQVKPKNGMIYMAFIVIIVLLIIGGIFISILFFVVGLMFSESDNNDEYTQPSETMTIQNENAPKNENTTEANLTEASAPGITPEVIEPIVESPLTKVKEQILGWWFCCEDINDPVMRNQAINMQFNEDGTFYLQTWREKEYGTYMITSEQEIVVNYDMYVMWAGSPDYVFDSKGSTSFYFDGVYLHESNESGGNIQYQHTDRLITIEDMEQAAAASADNDYIFNSNKEIITTAYLDTLSKDQIRLVLNEMYARHGYNFTKEPYLSYFASKPWYIPMYETSEETELYFNEIEMQNKIIIINYETAKGWR